MTTHKEALMLALDALENHTAIKHPQQIHYRDKAITAIKEVLTQEKALQALHDENERLGLYKDAYAQPEQDKERCFGCEACIDTACGRDECPNGWPKAAHPEQEQSGFFSREAMKAHSDFHVAHPEQEPVAWATQMGEYAHIKWGAKRPEYPMVYEVPLYTTPPQRTWVGLDEEDDIDWEEGGSLRDLVEAVEAKLKEKNMNNFLTKGNNNA